MSTTGEQTSKKRTRKRRTFPEPKEQVLWNYKRTLGSFLQNLSTFKEEYGEDFDRDDADIPEAHKLYYMLRGMSMCIQDKKLLAEVQRELAEGKEFDFE